MNDDPANAPATPGTSPDASAASEPAPPFAPQAEALPPPPDAALVAAVSKPKLRLRGIAPPAPAPSTPPPAHTAGKVPVSVNFASNFATSAPTPDSAAVAAGTAGAATGAASKAKPVRRRRRLPIGKEALIISVGIHVLIIIAAIFWITTTYLTGVRESPFPETFDPGAGGGAKSFRTNFREHRVQFRKPMAADATTKRILAKGTTAAVVPEIRDLSHSLLRGGVQSGMLAAGGGGGAGTGIGLGLSGSNYVGRMVFGMNIKARNIAVYLDNSGSMSPLPPNR